MINLVVTGGIATGKSSAIKRFQDLTSGVSLFDCDQEVHRLLTKPEFVAKIIGALGDAVADPGGQLNRNQLREAVFEDDTKRQALEGVLHPEVRKNCRHAQSLAEADSSTQIFIADVPLYYENEFPISFDYEIVVATTAAEQKKRLIKRNQFTETLADRMIRSQLPIEEKLGRSDIVVWNGGTKDLLSAQIAHLLSWLRKETNPKT